MSVGLLGFLVFCFAFIYPAYQMALYKDYLFLSVFVIGALSFLNEDTLETHAGTMFFAFFYSLFLFAKPIVAEGGEKNN